MTWKEIQEMIINAVSALWYGVESDLKEKVIESTTQIYIKQMELDAIRRQQEKGKAVAPMLEADGYSDWHLVFDTWRCPNCGCSYETETEQFDYCPHCGQAIDWAAVNNQTPWDD